MLSFSIFAQVSCSQRPLYPGTYAQTAGSYDEGNRDTDVRIRPVFSGGGECYWEVLGNGVYHGSTDLFSAAAIAATYGIPSTRKKSTNQQLGRGDLCGGFQSIALDGNK